MIAAAGLPVHLDPVQGFDHGSFAPLAIIYPDVDVPLFAALGAAEGDVATRVYHEQGLFGGVIASSFRFG